mmetsp:Transcript_16742/g.18732  ORF Transcript_16742/g.18732 Transcript_16742/m.18732 type:complete len:787 (+) Transcript_16742:120-2480(+)
MRILHRESYILVSFRRFMLYLVMLLLVLLLLASLYVEGKINIPDECPYKVLGIKNEDRNNIKNIKKAYRKKAAAAHPDKNPELDMTTATDNFHRITSAYDFLSDSSNKIRYDNMKRTYTQERQQQQQNRKHTFRGNFGSSSTNSQQQQRNQQKYEQQQREQQQERNKEHAEKSQILKEATMARQQVLKISTLEQLKDTLDKNMRFGKHFLCVFVADKNMESFVDNQLLFPYPFGRKGRNSFDWETVLQTFKIRYNQVTPLTRAFRVPTVQAAKRSGRPYIVFAKKGDKLNQFQIFKPRNWSLKPYLSLESWITGQLTTVVTVVNHHHVDIRIFTVKDDKAGLESYGGTVLSALSPGKRVTIPVSIADRIIALDENIDNFPGSTPMKNRNRIVLNKDKLDRVTMGSGLIHETEQTIYFGAGYDTTRNCYDLSFSCDDFVTQSIVGEEQSPRCQAQVEFAHTMCPYSCGVCFDSQWNGFYYILVHLPLHKVPIPFLRRVLSALRSIPKFVDVFLDDFSHLLSMRRNVTSIFFFLAFLAGIQFVLFAQSMLRGGCFTNKSRPFNNLGLILLLTISLAVFGVWMSHATKHQVHFALRGFHEDLRFLVRYSMDIVYGLLFVGFLFVITSKQLAQKLRRRQPELRRINQVYFLVFSVLLSALILIGSTYFLQSKMTRYNRWLAIWKLRKNVVVVIIFSGNMLGASVLGVGQYMHFLIESEDIRNLFTISVGIWCCGIGGIGLALQDHFFLLDLHHVLETRMSAAIPCAVMGMMFGTSLAYFFSNYQIKVKKD